ncbi:MAG: histidine phosphatase family protein [Oscillospiraceae bacterium]|nr:histidine phosphatase family protein [Oscillospiraceae bacterium]
MATNIYIIRHGESRANFEKRFMGHCDWDLTENGYKQAECAAQYFKDIRVDAVYSSTLQRAFHTAEAIAKTKGLSVNKSRRLMEIYAGDWELKTFDEIEAIDQNGEWKKWRDGKDADVTAGGGETLTEVLVRAYSKLEEIARAHDGENVVVASHGCVIRVLRQFLTYKTLSDISRTPWFANASITKLVYKDGKFSIEFENEREHLGSIVTVLPSNV